MTSDPDPTRTGDERRPAREHPEPRVARGPAAGTLVWGCVVLAAAVLLGASELAGLRQDLSLVVPVGMVVLGLLVVGAVAAAVRSDRGGSGPA